MLLDENNLILASASPRRRELLAQICPKFDIQSADINEQALKNESATDLVERLSINKAQKIASANQQSIVLGSDTVVVAGNNILGKPYDFDDFSQMMKTLSGRVHQVHTGVALVYQELCLFELVTTQISFADITTKEIERYWASGEPIDKAGGYAIQGLGGQFVKAINGNYSAVVGLPLFHTKQLIMRMQNDIAALN